MGFVMHPCRPIRDLVAEKRESPSLASPARIPASAGGVRRERGLRAKKKIDRGPWVSSYRTQSNGSRLETCSGRSSRARARWRCRRSCSSARCSVALAFGTWGAILGPLVVRLWLEAVAIRGAVTRITLRSLD